MKWNSKGYKKFDEEKAKEYGVIANEIFAPIYPVIARQIADRCRVEQGLCIDIGTGPANLAIALAKISPLHLYGVDFSGHISGVARENIEREELGGRVTLVVGDVHRLPFRDGVASLVVSRGSVRFWRNKPAAFKEIRRVLKPGGAGYIGGGMGSFRLGEEIGREMVERGLQQPGRPGSKWRRGGQTKWREIMEKAGFRQYEAIVDGSGSWVYLKKEDLER